MSKENLPSICFGKKKLLQVEPTAINLPILSYTDPGIRPCPTKNGATSRNVIIPPPGNTIHGRNCGYLITPTPPPEKVNTTTVVKICVTQKQVLLRFAKLTNHHAHLLSTTFAKQSGKHFITIFIQHFFLEAFFGKSHPSENSLSLRSDARQC